MISDWKIVFLFLLTSVTQNRGDNKIWTQTTSLDNPKLWRNEQLPCAGQPIVLPAEVIYVPSDFNFGSDIVLPKDNGLLLFAPNGNNYLLDENTCQDKEIDTKVAAQLKIQPYANWYDPQNWRSEFYANGIFSPIPHLHRIPCRYDQVIFPPNAAYKVSISETHPPVKISRLAINNIEMNSVQFRSFYSGGDGYSSDISRMIFQVNQTVDIYQDACPDGLEGCTCHEESSVKKTICSFQRCPAQPLCSSAIQPKDHCCYDICGAVIHIQSPEYVNVPFNMDQVEEQMKTLVKPKKSKWNPKMGDKSNEFENVRFHISRIAAKEYQIVVTDIKGQHSTSQSFAQKIYNRLLTDYEDYGFYIWTGNVFGILFLLGLIGALVYLATRGYKKEIVQASTQLVSSVTSSVQSMRGSGSIVESLTPMASAPHYDNFENEETTPEDEERQTDSTAIRFTDLKSKDHPDDDKGFANPMYEEPRRFENLYSPPPTKACQRQEEKTVEKCFQNPLFDVMVDINKEAGKAEADTEEVVEANESSTPDNLDLKQFLEKNFEEMEAKIPKEPGEDDEVVPPDSEPKLDTQEPSEQESQIEPDSNPNNLLVEL